MRRFGILIGVAVAVIAVILVVALSRFDVNQYRTQIETEMEQRLARKVVLGNLKLKLLPLRLRVENLAIAEDPDFGGQTPFLKADTVDLSMKLLPLLRHKVEIDGVEMQRPRAEVVKNTKGVWNFSSIGQGRHQTSSVSTMPRKNGLPPPRSSMRSRKVGQSLLMSAVVEIGESNPIERIGKKLGHGSRLGQP